MAKVIFIGATGTEIGKTYITCLLLRQLQNQGYKARALKPVISGFDPQDMATSDTGKLLSAMGEEITLDNAKKISPWRYYDPIPPHRAAQQTQQPIDIDELENFCQSQNDDDLDFLLIEGAGGIMTPLNYQYTTLDLIRRLDCSCLLVSGTYLGTLSHTSSMIACLTQEKIDISGIILSGSVESYGPLENIIEDFKGLFPTIPHRIVKRQIIPRPDNSQDISDLLI